MLAVGRLHDFPGTARAVKEVGVELNVERRPDGDLPVVAVAGEVDVHSAPQLREGLTAELQSASSAVVVDLTHVSFLDSTGLGALVAVRTAAGDKGIALPVVCTSERIMKLFTITGLDGVFDIHPDVDSALAAVKA
jgi:anti-sigma B factor antagonist